MRGLTRIALRNIREHKAKTLIIGLLITLGMILLVVGSSLLATASQGIEESFINNYTGHIMISGRAEGSVSLFGVQGTGAQVETPQIPHYQRVWKKVQSLEGVEEAAGQVSGMALITSDTEENPSPLFTFLFGIDPASYTDLFSNIKMVEGRFLRDGEEGLVMTQAQVEKVREERGRQLAPGDTVLLQGLSSRGFKIREVPLRGIFEFRQGSEDLNVISYADAQTTRALLGLTVGSSGAAELEEDETDLLEAEGGMFSGDGLMEDPEAAESSPTARKNFEKILGDTSGRDRALQIDRGAWHFILIKLKDGEAAPAVISRLNRWFGQEGIAARAADWKAAAGPYAATADMMRGLFTGAILLVSVVSLIIIMNTLVISVMERTYEIGTMRALGAQRSFIRRLFSLEILLICLIFGLGGILLGSGILAVIRLIGPEASNTFYQILFAGERLRPVIDPGAMTGHLVLITLLGLAANIYPLTLALKIQPITAMESE